MEYRPSDSESIKKKIIIWNDQKEDEGILYTHSKVQNGVLVGSGSSGPCYSPKRSIYVFIEEILTNFVILCPDSIKAKKSNELTTLATSSFLKPLTGFSSVFAIGNHLSLGKEIQDKILVQLGFWFFLQMALLGKPKDSDSDIVFLAKISQRWSYRWKCPICLKFPSTKWVNYWAVFRPCGHSMCVTPSGMIGGPDRDCFHKYQRHESKSLVFRCPICKTKVDRFFIPKHNNLGKFNFNYHELLEALDLYGLIKIQEITLLSYQKDNVSPMVSKIARDENEEAEQTAM